MERPGGPSLIQNLFSLLKGFAQICILFFVVSFTEAKVQLDASRNLVAALDLNSTRLDTRKGTALLDGEKERDKAVERYKDGEKPFLEYLEETSGTLKPPIEPQKNFPLELTEAEIDNILNDVDDRISKEFDVPETLRKRVEFWFQIYSKYSEQHHVVHHAMYPWIVFKVVDISDIQNGSGHKWTKYHRAKRYVDSEVAKVKATLYKLSKRKSFKNLNPYEAELYAAVFPITGKRQKILREAAANVRVQLGQKGFFRSGLVNSAKYLPHMEEIFSNKGLPAELTRIPFVESSFNEKAQSKVGASGVWQIMPYIGRHFAIVNQKIDERNSPLKATEMASRVLKENRQILKTWPLAVTAYNHGTGGLLRGIRSTRSNDLDVIIRKYKAKSFGFASANFYSSFLAALHAERYHNEIFGPLYKEDLLKSDVFQLSRRTRIDQILKVTGLDKETLRNYNLDLRKTVQKTTYLPRGYRLHLPVGYKARLADAMPSSSKTSARSSDRSSIKM